MGHATYSVSSRTLRSTAKGYDTKPVTQIFTQSAEKKIHAEMSPKGVVRRESRDSEAHPLTVPIQLYLDVTGSMGQIPHELVKTGLPTLMSRLIQNGVPDASLMFGAIGDHECDRFPLQVGQFESGDAELDMWLTRTYLEGGGGANAGESYLLAWYFASRHTVTDAWDKRKKKGFVITIGDEPCLPSLPANAVKELMGNTAEAQGTFTMEALYAEACERHHVYHIHVNHGRYGAHTWTPLLGQDLIEVSDISTIPAVISDLILRHMNEVVTEQPASTEEASAKAKDDTIPDML